MMMIDNDVQYYVCYNGRDFRSSVRSEHEHHIDCFSGFRLILELVSFYSLFFFILFCLVWGSGTFFSVSLHVRAATHLPHIITDCVKHTKRRRKSEIRGGCDGCRKLEFRVRSQSPRVDTWRLLIGSHRRPQGRPPGVPHPKGHRHLHFREHPLLMCHLSLRASWRTLLPSAEIEGCRQGDVPRWIGF